MKIQRADWLVADDALRKNAKAWWAPALAGMALEGALAGALLYAGKMPGPIGGCATAALMARAICGSIGAWQWFSAASPPEFWGYRAKWAMQFLPSAMLAWRRRAWVAGFIERLAPEDIDRQVALAREQQAFYSKGAASEPLGLHRREMASWAAAVRECQSSWASRQEAERMKSPIEREAALRELGLGRSEVKESMLSLERLAISKSSSVGDKSLSSRRL